MDHKDKAEFRNILARLDALQASIHSILHKVNHMANELDALKAAVQRNTDAEESAITLLNGLKTALDAAIASGDPAALSELSATIGAETDKLAAAVVANTPAA